MQRRARRMLGAGDPLCPMFQWWLQVTDYALVQTCRMHTKSEFQCRPETLGDSDVSVPVHRL